MHEYPGIIPGGEQMRPEDRNLIDPALCLDISLVPEIRRSFGLPTVV